MSEVTEALSLYPTDDELDAQRQQTIADNFAEGFTEYVIVEYPEPETETRTATMTDGSTMAYSILLPLDQRGQDMLRRAEISRASALRRYQPENVRSVTPSRELAERRGIAIGPGIVALMIRPSNKRLKILKQKRSAGS